MAAGDQKGAWLVVALLFLFMLINSGNHCQRAITLALVFEPVFLDEDSVGASAPGSQQRRAGLRDITIDG